MVDNVNLNLVNPFTNEVLTAEQIAALDTDKNGVIDHNEWEAGQEYLKETADHEGDAVIGESKVFDKLISGGDIKESAETQTELRNALTLFADEYLEEYFTQHSSLTSEEKAIVKSAVSDIAKTFPNEYIKQHPTGPYDVKAAALEMEMKIEEKIIEKKNLSSINTNMLNGYQNNTDSNWNTLINLLADATKNDNISIKEYNQIKNKLIRFLVGSLLNGEDNEEFFASMNKNYKTDKNYKKITEYIKTIQSSADPSEIKQAIIDLQSSINAFIEGCKQDDVTNAINKKQEKNIENKAKTTIAPAADKWKESQIAKNMSSEELEFLDKFIENATEKFIASIKETGEISTLTDQHMQELFTQYLTTQYEELKAERANLNVTQEALDKAFTNLVDISNKANENKNISDEEKESIVNAAADLIYKQLMSGMKDIPLLQSLGLSNQTGKIEELMNSLKNATSADEIKSLQTQIQDAIKELLNKRSGAELVTGINKLKPINIDNQQKNNIIFNSELYAEYSGNQDIVLDMPFLGKVSKDKMISRLQECAKEKLTALTEQIKAQMKKELGDAYDEAIIDECINSAINDTIADFTSNGFHVSNRFMRTQGSFNLKDLVDTFFEKFNEAAKVKSANKNNPTNGTYDKEDVLQEAGLTNDYYYTNKKVKGGDRAAILAEAKKTLESVATAIKASFAKQGSSLPSSVIDSIIENSMKETLSEYDFDQTAKLEKMNNGFSPHDKALERALSNTLFTRELVDMFLNKVDTKIEEEKKKAKESEETK